MLKKLLFIALFALAFAAQAAVNALPWGPKPQFVDANGAPMSGGTLTFFAAGSTTPQNTYTDSTGGVANSNPITLNSRGETPNEVWLTSGLSYKLVLKDSSSVTVWTVDNISGVNDTAASLDEWKGSGVTPTFTSGTTFTLSGDQTTEFHVGRRLKTTNSGGTIYSTITISSFAPNTTTVTVANDSGSLDSGLSAVSYGILRSTNPSVPILADSSFIVSGSSDRTKKGRLEMDGVTAGQTRVATFPDYNFEVMSQTHGSDVASAATVNLDTATGDLIDVTGTTTITAITLSDGRSRTVRFTGALTITHGSSLILPGARSITTTAGSYGIFRGYAGGIVRCVLYEDVNGRFPKGYLYGGILSNNGSDATNDIDITAGQTKDSTGAADITWSALTKQLDAAFAAGTNAGMRDTGSIANGTWHIFAIKKDSDGSGDILASTSATAPTMPSGYTYFRRIGSILRESAAIVAFKQVGDTFWRAMVTDYSSASARAIALLTLSVPTGLEVQPLITLTNQQSGVAGDATWALAPGFSSAMSYQISSTNVANHRDDVDVVGPATNTSAQIYLAVTISSGALASGVLRTHGWIDRRGRDAAP